MNSGIYISTSGASIQSARNDLAANNLANLSTFGFKKQLAVFRERAPESVELGVPSTQLNMLMEGIGGGAALSTLYTDFNAGAIIQTGEHLDFAIDGEGFFVVTDGNENFYTRSGSFTKDYEGYIVTSNGKFKVVGQDGATIKLNENDPMDLQLNNVQVQVVAFEDMHKLVRKGETLYRDPASESAGIVTASTRDVKLGTVRRGYLEESNVNPVIELVSMIEGYRAYEANMRAIRNHDQSLGRAVNDVGRVR